MIFCSVLSVSEKGMGDNLSDDQSQENFRVGV